MTNLPLLGRLAYIYTAAEVTSAWLLLAVPAVAANSDKSVTASRRLLFYGFPFPKPVFYHPPIFGRGYLPPVDSGSGNDVGPGTGGSTRRADGSNVVCNGSGASNTGNPCNCSSERSSWARPGPIGGDSSSSGAVASSPPPPKGPKPGGYSVVPPDAICVPGRRPGIVICRVRAAPAPPAPPAPPSWPVSPPPPPKDVDEPGPGGVQVPVIAGVRP